MNLKKLIFADGTIRSYEKVKDRVVVYFEDYRQSEFKILFDGVSELYDNDGVGYSISDSDIEQHGDDQEIIFRDEDMKVMLRMRFSTASVEPA